MALEGWTNAVTKTMEASASLASSQHLFVKNHTTEDQCALAGAGDKVEGILMNAPVANGEAQILVEGEGMAIAGGTIAIDDYCKSDASGQAVVTTTAGDEVCCKALSAATSGKQVRVRMMRFRY